MTISQWADLEITLHRDRDNEGSYSVDLRFEHYNETDHFRHNQVFFDRRQLREHAPNIPAYGRMLGEMLFAGDIYRKFDAYRAQLNGYPMRIRLVIGTDAAELQGLRWETLRDPKSGDCLLGARTPFSRYVSSTIDRNARRQYPSRLRALITVANPGPTTRFSGSPIDTATYLDFAHQIIGNHECIELIEDRATLDNMINELRRGCDLLYIVAHGGILGNEPCFLLKGSDGEVSFESVEKLVHCIRNLPEVPQLAMLISCDSAGTEQDIFQAEPSVALGPLLAEAGIPAVIAMQGRISTKTATHFLKVFVEELQRTGIIDVAAATARDSIYDNTDAWMPVLFMRSNDGILWRRSQPVTERQAFDKWKSLIQHIKAGTCVPIIGPGLLEPLIGSTSEIAADLVERHSLELEATVRTSLPHVAQLLQLRMDRTSMRREISDLLYEKLSQHNGGIVPDDPDTTPLYEWLRAVNCKRIGFDPYHALANLPCPLFVNATADPLLEYALHDMGRDPYTVICPWSNDLDWANGAFPFAGSILSTLHDQYVADPLQVATDQYFVPSKQKPVVYHPFGIFQLLSSLVLTEDDYFQYLVGNTKNQSKMPPAVRYGLTSSALLFLGFQLDDWGFRVLLREILQLENNGLPNRFTHVAVQIDPATPSGTIQQRIEYLEEQFRAYHITVYWGSTTDFIRKLHDEFIQVTQVHLKNRAIGSQAVTQPSGITASHNRL